ncbi:hypothetical protein HK105_202047 [Polyrhizophydium stewartii]|uniref:FAR-17a/AIG1-like protein n=1 Tax=Polyrhizophydium stewartii TaxID=2732419 RepID=A0ABR4NGQ7_9FUNG|nr:hypothetical protein HK105_005920 [Polyrhizophydium stewartii]
MDVHTAFGSRLVSARALYAVRGVFAIFSMLILVWKLATDHEDYVRYMTSMSWFGITAYFVTTTAAAAALRNARPTERLPHRLALPIRFLFATMHTTALIVSLVFWLALRSIAAQSAAGMDRFLTVVPHSANFVMTQAELWLSNQPYPATNAIPVIAVMALYCLWTWAEHYVAGIPWPYEFFDTMLDLRMRGGMAVLWLLAFVLAITGMFAVIWAEAQLRDRLLPVVTPESDSDDDGSEGGQEGAKQAKESA